jgi:hypothetical protein
MSKCGNLGIVVDMALADQVFVVYRECHVASDTRQGADWRALELRGFAFGQYNSLTVALFLEERSASNIAEG